MIYELEIEALLVKATRSMSASKNLCAEALLLTKDMKISKHSAVISFFGREFIRSGLLSNELYGHLFRGF